MVLKSYDSNNLVTLSDHRPVFAQFLIRIDLSELESECEDAPLSRAVANQLLSDKFKVSRRMTMSSRSIKQLNSEELQQHVTQQRVTGEISQVKTKACLIF